MVITKGWVEIGWGDTYQGIYDFSHEEKVIKRSIIQIGNYSMILFY